MSQSPSNTVAATATTAQAPTKPKFACPICEARSLLADAMSAELKAAAQVYHLANHWRTAHETRELSNFAAEERTAAVLAQFELDTGKEADWFEEYQNAIKAHGEAPKPQTPNPKPQTPNPFLYITDLITNNIQ
jgi:hypothetical protein